MTLSCEQCIDISALVVEIYKEIDNFAYDMCNATIQKHFERNGTEIDLYIKEDYSIEIARVFVQGSESVKLANYLTDYFNER